MPSDLNPLSYEEDEEVIQHEHWNDYWQKNDSCVDQQRRADDVVDSIMRNVVSNDNEFKIRTRAFLDKWRDIFSRTLSEEPALLPPLELEVDAQKW